MPSFSPPKKEASCDKTFSISSLEETLYKRIPIGDEEDDEGRGEIDGEAGGG